MAIYIGTASAAFFLLAASVLQQLFFRTPAVDLPKSSIVAGQPDPRQFLICNNLVSEQLTSLSAKTNTLFEQPLVQPTAQDSNRASEWKNFSTQWQDQWDVVEARCRFSELAETTMGEAYDRMAHVHEALPAMRLKYNSLLAEFDREQADELTEMSSALERSRRSILRMSNQDDLETNPPTAHDPASAVGSPP